MNVDDFLMQPSRLEVRLERARSEYEIAKSQAEKTNAVLSPATSGKGQNKDFSLIADRKIELEKEIKEIENELNEATRKIDEVIQQLPNLTQQRIIHKKYREKKNFVIIADELGLTEQHVRRLKGNALKEIQKIINKKEEQ